MKKTKIILLICLLTLIGLVSTVSADTYVPGFSASYYQGQTWTNLMGSRYDNYIHFADALAVGSYGWVSDENFWPIAMVGQDDDFSVMWDGYIHIPTAATYTFYLTSDDGSWLWINDNLVVDNSGLHPPLEVSGSIALTEGYHQIVVKMFETSGVSDNIAVTYLEYSLPGVSRQLVPGYHKTTNPNPVPEFPFAFLPAIMIIGMLGAVMFIQRTREY